MSGQRDEKIIFRKVSVAMNRDEKYLALSPIPPSGRGLWHHLLFGPHTTPISGLSLIGRAAMAEELGWSLEAFDEAFGEVIGQGMAEADWQARVVWLPNALRHNPPQSHNVVKGWRKYWDEIPDCQLKLKAYDGLRAGLKAFDGTGKFLKLFDEGCRKPSGKPSLKPFPKPSPKANEKANPEPKGIQRAESRENPTGYSSVDKSTEAPSLPDEPSAHLAYDPSNPVKTMFHLGKSLWGERQGGSLVGKLRKAVGDDGEAAGILRDIVHDMGPEDGRSYLMGIVKSRERSAELTPRDRGDVW